MPNGIEPKILYTLGHVIYPGWHLFIKSTKNTTNLTERRFISNQEATQKDVERLFGFVKGLFQICNAKYVRGSELLLCWSQIRAWFCISSSFVCNKTDIFGTKPAGKLSSPNSGTKINRLEMMLQLNTNKNEDEFNPRLLCIGRANYAVDCK